MIIYYKNIPPIAIKSHVTGQKNGGGVLDVMSFFRISANTKHCPSVFFKVGLAS